MCLFIYRFCTQVSGWNSGGAWATHEKVWGEFSRMQWCSSQAVKTIQISPSLFFHLLLGLSRQSRVSHDLGRDKTHVEIHLTEFPHGCCTCVPGTTSVSVCYNAVIPWSRHEKKRLAINLFFRNIGNTMLSVLSKMQRATFMPGDHRTWNV